MFICIMGIPNQKLFILINMTSSENHLLRHKLMLIIFYVFVLKYIDSGACN